MKSNTSRRSFFQKLGILGIGSVAASALPVVSASPPAKGKKKAGFELGVASYGLRKLSFEELIDGMQVLGIKNISLKSMHLPFELSKTELKERMAKIRDAGLNPYAPGVVYMKSEQEVHDRFAYTQTAGMKMIVAVPNYDLLELVNEKVKDSGISIAIHTHGPDGQPYPTPEDAFKRLEGMDPRMGICIDLGHTLRSGLDPSDQIKVVKERLLDVHIKDVTKAAKAGSGCRPGQGVFDFESSLQALIDIDYQGFVSIEYEKEADNPIPGYAEMKGYINGVLKGMGA